MRKTYDKEFKLQAVRMVKEDGKRIAEVARELDLAEQTLHNWVKKYNQGKEASFVGSGNVQPENKMEYDLQKRPEVIYDFIYKHRHEFRVAKMCEVLGVSKSGYYVWLNRPKSEQKKRRERLTARIKRIHLESRKIYGSPKITKTLNAQGIN